MNMGGLLVSIAVLSSAIALLATAGPAGAVGPAAIAIPRVEGITIDGKAEDWGEGGFRINILGPDVEGPPPQRFDGCLRIGWDDRGLLVLAVVHDTVPFEAAQPDQIWRYDHVYVLVTAPSGEMYEVCVAPGRYPKPSPPRLYAPGDRRKPAADNATAKVTAERTIAPDGYTMELLLPWAAMNITPAIGARMSLRVASGSADEDRRR